MIPFGDIPARQPRNWFERLLWLHGRKFWLALFAGVSSFAVAVAGISIAAAIESAEIARVIEQIVSGYLLAAAGLVTAYTAGNAVIEKAYARTATAAATSGAPEPGPSLDPPPAPAPRASGVVGAPDA